LDKKTAQTEADEREAADAATTIEGRASCIEMVRGELDTAREACKSLEAQSQASERAHADKRRLVEELKVTNQTRQRELKVRADSEASVLLEQQRYVSSLEDRLRNETLQLAELNEEDGDMGDRKFVSTSAAAVLQLLEELDGRLKLCESAHMAAKLSRDKEEKRVSAEAQRLKEQREAMVDALAKLGAYEQSLKQKLSSVASPGAHESSSTLQSSAESAVELIDRVSHSFKHRAKSGRVSHSFKRASDNDGRPVSPNEITMKLEVATTL